MIIVQNNLSKVTKQVENKVEKARKRLSKAKIIELKKENTKIAIYKIL